MPPQFLTKKGVPLLVFFIIILIPISLQALEPRQVLVIANRNAAKSIELAHYYMNRRRLPAENLLKLWLTDNEVCDRLDYDKKIATPIRKYISKKNLQHRIKCLVLIYGIPLRVQPAKLSWKEKQGLDRLKDKQERLLVQKHNTQDQEQRQKINYELTSIKKEIKRRNNKEDGASVDSELSLLMAGDYPLTGWIVNPYFLGARGKKTLVTRDKILLVSRLDGPTDDIVKRVIDSSLKTEKIGLSGTAYFDARWPAPGNKKVSGYALYDKSIHKAADFFKESSIMPAVLEETESLFQSQDCPDAALYCGWYSLGHYVDAFSWKPGAIGYHIASSECTTLKRKGSQVWCKMMLEDGVAATIGPVAEPYVQAFPIPELFFRLIAEQRLNLVESYFLSLPFISWQMVLIGDPLYTPFKVKQIPLQNIQKD